LVFLVASDAAGCEYCVAHGASKAINKGVLESKLEEVWEFETSPLFDADEHFDELRRHFDDDAIVEIVGVIAFSGFMNRWNATMGTTLEEQPRSVAERLLAGRGWEIGPHD
jgi:AhpD family alkylhydroperoxidase